MEQTSETKIGEKTNDSCFLLDRLLCYIRSAMPFFQVTARFDGAIPLWGISELKSNAVGEADRPVQNSPAG